ncbi:hypothetical protein AAMO2058_001168700 [Amorphochlora amoebiformis]|mmetsp:Transcript_17091/g.27163  ORF Transcript_17091/g.27163 Transcript_17091/m.27163 type:complete len:600 (-) Transcript_17091:484-2283(-)
MLHIQVDEARGLLAADSNGLSDPYCKFIFMKKKSKTKTIPKTLRPIWHATFHFKANASDLETKLLFQVKDEDKFGRNDFLGEITVDLKAVLNGPIAGWFSLKNEKGEEDEKKRGQIRIKIAYEQDKEKCSRALSIIEQKQLTDSKTQHLDVFVGTWNVGNAPPPSDLSAWIPKDKYTLYVIGAQECKYKPREGFTNCEEDWLKTLTNYMGPKYILLKAKSLSEMRICLFAKKEESFKFINFEVATEATGIGHVIANKGGVAISVSYNDTTFCFINAHLAAHQHKVERRNSDVQEIMNGISKILGRLKVDVQCQFDHIVFMGDLNYRLDYGDQGEKKTPSKEQFDEMVSMIKGNELSKLFKVDQLQSQMAKGRVFCGFKEGRYNFAPTFKVLRQKELAYTPERSPSWCDRILWHSMTKEWIEQMDLGAGFDIDTSDHKPVYTVLRMPVYNLPSITDHTVSSITIALDQVKCFRLPTMDQNGLADPYLHLMGTFFPDSPSNVSKVIKKTLNPVFDNLPEIKSSVLNPERLKHCFLIIKIADKDLITSSTIGYTVLPLRWFLPERHKTTKTKMFRHRIMKGGIYIGNAVIQGQVTIRVDKKG